MLRCYGERDEGTINSLVQIQLATFDVVPQSAKHSAISYLLSRKAPNPESGCFSAVLPQPPRRGYRGSHGAVKQLAVKFDPIATSVRVRVLLSLRRDGLCDDERRLGVLPPAPAANAAAYAAAYAAAAYPASNCGPYRVSDNLGPNRVPERIPAYRRPFPLPDHFSNQAPNPRANLGLTDQVTDQAPDRGANNGLANRRPD